MPRASHRGHEHGDYSCTGDCFGIRITTRQALERWKRTGNPSAGSTVLLRDTAISRNATRSRQ